MSEKHSPGPWRWGPDRMDGMNTLLDANGNDVAFAQSYDDFVKVPNQADAELIASAPQLAADLDAANKRIGEMVGLLREWDAESNGRDDVSWKSDWHDRREALLARIDGAGRGTL